MDYLVNLLNELICFIEPYKLLLDTHNIQFITDLHWSNTNILNENLKLELEDFLVTEKNLIKYFNEINSSETRPNLMKLFGQVKQFKAAWHDRVLTNINDLFKEHNVTNETSLEFEHKFELMKKQNRFMNQKKTYEVDTMSIFVAKLCRHLQIETIVDIGAGRAYLSTQLSSPVFDSFNVIAIDSKEKYVESSINRLAVMKRKTTSFSTKSNDLTDTNFTTFNQFIQSSTKLNELIESQSNDNNKKSDFALVGLHSCGNLSNSIVNLYLDNQSNESNKKCKLLFNVACCYNLLNEKYSNDNPNDCPIDETSKFPMSDYLNKSKYSLGFNIRMIACHNFERTLESLEDFRELNNENLWYRCVLQDILESDLFKSTNNKIGRKLIKDKSIPDNFNDYVRKAIEKLELENEKISDNLIEDFWNKNLNLKAKFNIYIQLKMILAPIIEYIILLDRLIYLNEFSRKSNRKFNHYLIKIFDPLMSPRCHALVSFYEQQ